MESVFFKLLAVLMLSAFAALLLRQYKKELSLGVVTACCVVVTGICVHEMTDLFARAYVFFNRAGLDSAYFDLLLKCVGIAYLARLSAQICTDAGETALALKAEFCGKLVILSTALPILLSLADALLSTLGL